MDVELAKHEIQKENLMMISYVKGLVRMNSTQRHIAGFKDAEEIVKSIRNRLAVMEIKIKAIESQIQE